MSMDERNTISRFEHDKEMLHLNWCNRRMLIALIVSMLAMIIAIITFVNGYNVREKLWLETVAQFQQAPEVSDGKKTD